MSVRFSRLEMDRFQAPSRTRSSSMPALCKNREWPQQLRWRRRTRFPPLSGAAASMDAVDHPEKSPPGVEVPNDHERIALAVKKLLRPTIMEAVDSAPQKSLHSIKVEINPILNAYRRMKPPLLR